MASERDDPEIPHAFLARVQRCIDVALPPDVRQAPPLALHRARLLVASSALASLALLASVTTLGFAGPGENVAAACAGLVLLSGVPLLWWTRSIDLAANATPAGLFVYSSVSLWASGGVLPFPALMTPIAALVAGLLCTRTVGFAWVAGHWLVMPAAVLLSPQAGEASTVEIQVLLSGLLFALPVFISVRLYRDLFERVFAERTAIARDAQAATERQAALDARLQESERHGSLARMASGVAHDFNNILAAIGGSAELITLSSHAGSTERELAQRITGSVDRASALLRQLLDFTGRGRRRLETLCLSERVQESARILEAGLSKETTLEVQVFRDARVVADPVQINQLIVQLVQNAERAYAGKPGAIGIEIDCVDDVEPAVTMPSEGIPVRAYAVLRVIDRGCGINPGDERRIFEPFFHGFPGGRGLGLAAALGIVRGHDGGIAVETAIGAGTRMTIYLPREAGGELRPAAAAPDRPAAASLAGLRVLVVDDEPGFRAVLQKYLADAGASVHQARDGVHALEKLASVQIDAAFVDVSMPRLNGRDLLEALRASGRDFPVVLMTGHADVDIARFGEEANVAVLLKPFRLDELAVALERARRRPPAAPR
jgi:signal transduction histidine kinase/ActR/RegA family two-component response regulator